MHLGSFTVDNRNRLVFYGNMVGYVKDSTAVVTRCFRPTAHAI